MAETENPTLPQEPTDIDVVVKPNKLQSFVNKHPRASKYLAITGGVLGALGTAQIARTVSANKHHAVAAGEHLAEAGSELAATTSPTVDAEA